MTEAGDLAAEYREYLVRFEKQVGKVPIGAPGKWKGRLVTKLAYGEFEHKLLELRKFEHAYRETLERGDTVSDAVIKLLKDRSAELLIGVQF
jgi:hypothetical protein